MSNRKKKMDPGQGQRKITSFFKPAAKTGDSNIIDLVSDSDSDGEETQFGSSSPHQPGTSSSFVNPLKSSGTAFSSSTSYSDAAPGCSQQSAISEGNSVTLNKASQNSESLTATRVEALCLETSSKDVLKPAKSPYLPVVLFRVDKLPKNADVTKKRKIMEEKSDAGGKTPAKRAGINFDSGESSSICSMSSDNLSMIGGYPLSTPSLPVGRRIPSLPNGSSLQPGVSSSRQLKSTISIDSVATTALSGSSRNDDYEKEEHGSENEDDSLFEAEENDCVEMTEKRKRFRSLTLEIETSELMEKVADLPLIVFSFDTSGFEKVVTDGKKRVEIYQKAFEGFCKSVGISPGKSKIYTCCGKGFNTPRLFKDHVSKDHIPSGSLSLPNLEKLSPLKICGNVMQPNIEEGIRSGICGDFIYHFEKRALYLKNKSRDFLYDFLLIKGLPQNVSETDALQYAITNNLVIEKYTGKYREPRRNLKDTVCSEYHFFRAKTDGNGGSVVTQHMLQGYRCFYVVKEENEPFETKEQVERAEMLTQLFNKLCSKYTEFFDTKLKFTCRQTFEHEAASKYLTKETFLQMVQAVVKCKGQLVVTGNDSVCVPFNGNYGQLKPVKLVEKCLDPRANFKLGDDVEKKKPHVPISLIMSQETFTFRQKLAGLDLDYNLEDPNQMETLWNILHAKYTNKFRVDLAHTVALVIVVPSSYDYRKKNVYHFLSEEKMGGRKIRYTFLLNTETYFTSKVCNKKEKYLVLRRWNFSSLDDKIRFYSIACIFAHFQTALSNNIFEYVDFQSVQLRYIETRRTLSDLDLRYAFALGNSGRPAICIEENCIENHYVYSDESFTVPIHIDERVIVDIPLKNNKGN